ncbi:MAG: polysaccharide deacetylase family protein [Nitrospiraceae bacterium]|nr:MAG: polysaccharide deacetylase family protein [Nitrospiraceae bacterium]
MKKKIFINILHYTGLLYLFLFLKKLVGKREAIILCYHRVIDVDDIYGYPLMHGVIDASVRDFERQMKFLSRHFNVMSLSALSGCYRSGKLPRNAVVVTFDDGYKDNFTNAYPILKKYGIPATIFLITDFIGEGRLLWWDKLAYIIKKTSLRKISFISNGSVYEHDLSSSEKRLKALKTINAMLKRYGNEEREDILEQLENKSGVTIDEYITKDLSLLWDDVREMQKNGIEIGAHTETHPIMINLHPAVVKKEIVSSKQRIEQETSGSVKAFAYPSGQYNGECVQYVKDAGFEIACGYELGANDINSDFYTLKRLPVDHYDDFNIFRAKLILSKNTRHKSKRSV